MDWSKFGRRVRMRCGIGVGLLVYLCLFLPVLSFLLCRVTDIFVVFYCSHAIGGNFRGWLFVINAR